MAHAPKFLQLLPVHQDTQNRSLNFANFPVVSFFPRLWDRVNALHFDKLQNKMGFLKDNFITMATMMGVIAGIKVKILNVTIIKWHSV